MPKKKRPSAHEKATAKKEQRFQLAKDSTLGVTVFVGTIVFLYQLAQLLQHKTSWQEMQTPVGVGEILVTLLAGLGAIGAGMGLNVGNLVKSFLKPKE